MKQKAISILSRTEKVIVQLAEIAGIIILISGVVNKIVNLDCLKTKSID